MRGELRDLDVLRGEAANADALVYCAQEQSAEAVAAERTALADRALRRVGERFAWPAVARATVEQYHVVMETAC